MEDLSIYTAGEKLRNKLFYELDEDLEKNPFKTTRIPLGLKGPFSEYEDITTVSKNDIYYFEIIPVGEGRTNTKQIAIISKRGSYKSTLLKRLMTYYHFNDYQITCFDPKNVNFSLAKYKGTDRNILPGERPFKLPVTGFLPSFISSDKQRMFAINNFFKVQGLDFNDLVPYKFTLDIRTVRTLEEARTLTDPKLAGVNIFYQLLRSERYTLPQIIEIIEGMSPRQIDSRSKMALLSRLRTLEVNRVFNAPRHKILDIKPLPDRIDISEFWRKHNIPSFNFFGADNRIQAFVIGKILELEIDYQGSTDLPMLNIFDDAQVYFFDESDLSSNIIAQQTIDLYRTLGFHGIFSFQNPMIFKPTLFQSCDDIFVGQTIWCENLSRALRYYGAKNIIENLRIEGEGLGKEYEYVHFPEDRKKYQTFFPAGAIVGHEGLVSRDEKDEFEDLFGYPLESELDFGEVIQ